ncbi:hypothetical protein SISSUDRAFT_1004275 [Sistotremastrum suecicum HHB10207 ss-3]|uniref:Ribosome assembly factor mrt4 n=1 Tax=Sistotremastrum suecicum HHB10207 ss-3 TaxID=1314776 RepID=A0A166DU68_9AGAM|nr:hypothetical protein SISSUDRAFT_1004275 [Sistotremastrum suecicum HHB10207 ss-3]
MPKSKRSKVVSLTKTAKKTKEQKGKIFEEVQANADKWKYIWLFSVGSMRNAPLKDVRKLWKDSGRLIFARSSLMAKALGDSPETEHKTGLHKLAQKIQGQVGLFFTDTEPQEVIDWFDDFKVPEFARAKNVSTKTVVLPIGAILQHHSDIPEPFPHSMDPQLRKLGLVTTLDRGVPSLTSPHVVCKDGDVLTAEQAQLLKLIGEKLVTFKVVLQARWEAATGELTQLVSDSEMANAATDEVVEDAEAGEKDAEDIAE